MSLTLKPATPRRLSNALNVGLFTAKGIKLKSGQELEADIIVTATGLHVQMLGGAEITVDGARSCYDTCVEDHPHFYWEDEGRLTDAPAGSVSFADLPSPPPGAKISSRSFTCSLTCAGVPRLMTLRG
mgnify:CR=1 FL=1